MSGFRGLEECVLDNNGVVFTEVITGLPRRVRSCVVAVSDGSVIFSFSGG